MTEPWCYKYFTFDHLPEGPLRECSALFAGIANEMMDFSSLTHHERVMRVKSFRSTVSGMLPSNPESLHADYKFITMFDYLSCWDKEAVGLNVDTVFRILLETKDCAVRSLLPVSQY